MNVSRNPSAGGLTDIHPQIDSVWGIKFPQRAFHLLSQIHHFVRGFRRQLPQLVKMCERHNHHVSRRVREAIEDDETMLAPVND